MSRVLLKQASGFAAVGGLGTITNLAIFFVLVDLLGVAPLLGATVAFVIAVSQNYVLNELWTFNQGGTNQVSRHRFAKFVFFSSIALCVNLFVLQLLIQNFDFPYAVIPQAAGIFVATFINFATSRLITFRL